MREIFAADGMSVALLNFKKILDLCGGLGAIQFYCHSHGWRASRVQCGSP
jgi:hypothetical protein